MNPASNYNYYNKFNLGEGEIGKEVFKYLLPEKATFTRNYFNKLQPVSGTCHGLRILAQDHYKEQIESYRLTMLMPESSLVPTSIRHGQIMQCMEGLQTMAFGASVDNLLQLLGVTSQEASGKTLKQWMSKKEPANPKEKELVLKCIKENFDLSKAILSAFSKMIKAAEKRVVEDDFVEVGVFLQEHQKQNFRKVFDAYPQVLTNELKWKLASCAIQSGSTDTIRWLRDCFPGFMSETKDVTGRNLLHEAAAYDKPEIFDVLTPEELTSLITQTNRNGVNPAFTAAEQGHLAFLNRVTANPELRGAIYTIADDVVRCTVDKAGRNIGHYAVKNGHTEVLDMLMGSDRNDNLAEVFEHLTQVLRSGDREKHSILHYAAKIDNHDSVNFILKNEQLSDLVNARDNKGFTVLHTLADADNGDLFEEVATSRPALLTEKDNKGRTAAEIAEERESQEVLEALERLNQ